MMPAVREVILWGIGDFAETYTELLGKAAITIKYCVDAYCHGSSFRGRQVISPWRFKERWAADPLTPVVITGRSQNGEDRFVQIVHYITGYLGMEGVRVLHPSFVADYLDLDFKNKVCLMGVPGAGNILLATIVEKLLQKSTAQQGQREALFETLSKEHFFILYHALNDIFRMRGVYFTNYHPFEVLSVTYQACRNRGLIFINGIASKLFFYDVQQTHARPSSLNIFTRMGYRMVTPLRNPLDVIVSIAFKLHALLVHFEPERDLNQPRSSFRQYFGLMRLANPDWFAGTASMVKEYYEGIIERLPQVFPVKYEDLLADPAGVIGGISDYLGIGHNKGEREALWEEVGFKPLIPGEKAHIFAPGSGKWTRYLTKGHMKILRSLDYGNLLKALGYDVPLCCDRESVQVEGPPPQGIDLYLAVDDSLKNQRFAKPVHFTHPGVVSTRRSRPDLEILTNDQDLLQCFDYAMTSPFFRALLSSLDV